MHSTPRRRLPPAGVVLYIGVGSRLWRPREDQPVDVRLVIIDAIQTPRRGSLGCGLRVLARDIPRGL